MKRRSILAAPLAFLGVGADNPRPFADDVSPLFVAIRRYSLGALYLIEDDGAREYSLTISQRDQLDRLFIKERMRLIDALSRVRFARQPEEGVFQANFWRSNTRILGVLTPEQRKQWDEDMKRFLADRRPVILEN